MKQAIKAIIAFFAASAALAQPVLDPLIPGEVIARLRPGASIAAVNARHGTTTLDMIPGHNIYLLQTTPGSEEAVGAAIDEDADVLYAEVNYLGDTGEVSGVARSFFFNISGNAAGYEAQPAWEQISLASAHTRSVGAGIVVAVVDTGVDAAHPALNGRVLPGFNTLNDTTMTADPAPAPDLNGDGAPDANLMGGHGTHVAAAIAWVAPQAQIMPIVALNADGRTDLFHAAHGIFAAVDGGADVINCSFGTTYVSDTLADAVATAAAEGIPVIAAAGNVTQTATAIDGVTPEFPAAAPTAIGVAAVAADGNVSSVSKLYGVLALSAPGEAIQSAVPGGQYAAWTGTSMAAPLVSGTTALLLALHPEWVANSSRIDLVRGSLQAGATPIPGNPQAGSGTLDANRTLTVSPAFDPPQMFAAGAGPGEVVLADFNGDGFADLASTNVAAGSVSVRLTAAAGVYGDAVTLPSSNGPRGIVAADFSGDGLTDLAVSAENGTQVTVFTNLGAGAFGPGVGYSAGAEPIDLAVLDFDGDNDADIAAVAQDSNAVFLLRNNGSGVFSAAGSIAVGDRPIVITAGDVDGQAGPDLVVGNRNTNSLSLLRSNGAGGFLPAATIAVGDRPFGLAIGDYDADGHNDIFVAVRNARLLVLRNVNNTFSMANGVTLLTAGNTPNAIAVADVNHDGRLDVLAALESVDTGAGQLSIYRGTGVPADPFSAPLGLVIGASPTGLALGDADADRDLDIAVANSASANVALVLNHAALRGDLNCDGRADMFDIDAFVLALTVPADYAAQFPGCSAETADLDRDGALTNMDIDPFVALLLQGGAP